LLFEVRRSNDNIIFIIDGSWYPVQFVNRPELGVRAEYTYETVLRFMIDRFTGGPISFDADLTMPG
jgi:hypothetical protein